MLKPRTWVWLLTTGVELLVSDSLDSHDIPFDRDVILPEINSYLNLVAVWSLVDVPQINLVTEERQSVNIIPSSLTHIGTWEIVNSIFLNSALQLCIVRNIFQVHLSRPDPLLKHLPNQPWKSFNEVEKSEPNICQQNEKKKKTT